MRRTPHLLLSAEEAAIALKASLRTVRRRVAQGRIQAIRRGRRVLFDPADLRPLIEEQKRRPRRSALRTLVISIAFVLAARSTESRSAGNLDWPQNAPVAGRAQHRGGGPTLCEWNSMGDPAIRVFQRPQQCGLDDLFPEAIRHFAKDGRRRSIDAALMNAYAWLYELAGRRLPAQVEFRLSDLSRYWGRASSSSAVDWIEGLGELGLLTIIERDRGRGRARVELYDPAAVCSPEVVRGDPQKYFGGLEPAAEEELECGLRISVTDPATAGEEEALRNSARYSATSLPSSIPAALREAICAIMGQDNAVVHFGISRFDEANGPKLFLPDDFARGYIGREYGRALRDAAAAAGFPRLEIEVDQSLRNSLRNSATRPQEEQLVKRSSTGASFNQQTEQREVAPTGAKHPMTVDQVAATLSQPAELLVKAKWIFNHCADATSYGCYSIFAALLLERGDITQRQLAELMVDASSFFSQSLPRIAGEKWPRKPMRWLKAKLAAGGTRWKREWERSREDGRRRS